MKVSGIDDKRVEALRIAGIFDAEVVDAGLDFFIFEAAHRPDKLDRFIELMKPLGMVEMSRTGVVAIARGKEGL